jgi:hypothetical protein
MHEEAMAIPERAYDRLQNLWRRLGLSQEDIYYAIENDQLRTSVWMPMRFMERGVIKDGKFVFVRHECREGFIGVRPQDFHRICSTGRAKLRIFRSVKQEDHILRLAYEPPQPGITVRIHDLVVLQEDRKRFEKNYDLPQDNNTLHFPVKPGVEGNFRYSNDYRHITLNGHEYRLGDVQARIIEQLHDAARSRQPWVHGKTLIYESGSQALRVRDIFKHQRKWRELIKSDDRGYYRLNIPSNELQNNPASGAVESQHHEPRHQQKSNHAG